MKSIQSLMSLAGRRAVLLGGGGKIAFAAAEALLELGAQAALLDVDVVAGRCAAAELNRRWPGAARFFSGDLSSEKSTRRALRTAAQSLGGVDILVHCAALTGTTPISGWVAPLVRQTTSAWNKALAVNLTSAFVAAQELRPLLVKSGRGSVIFVSSIYGFRPPDPKLYQGTSLGTPAGYAASKAGLAQLAKYLAVHLAPAVRVNVLSPGGVRRGQPAAFQRRYVSHTPLARMADEEDLKGAVAYLAGDLSAYVTGHDLVVDGGWSLW